MERSHANKEMLTEKYNKKQVYLKEMQLKIKNLNLEIFRTHLGINQLESDL